MRSSLTFDSGRVPSPVNAKPEQVSTVPRMRFIGVNVTGPIIEQWPTAAMQAILPNSNTKPSRAS